MKKNNFNVLWKTFSQAKDETEQMAIMKEFTLNSTLEELLAWNAFLKEKTDKSLNKILKKGLSDIDKAWFKEQFTKFDELENKLRNSNERKAA